MYQLVEQILLEIPSGTLFDSHYVTNTLKEKHLKEYNAFIVTDDPNSVLSKHRKIGHMIKSFRNIVIREKRQSWSGNVNGNSSECAAWRRL